MAAKRAKGKGKTELAYRKLSCALAVAASCLAASGAAQERSFWAEGSDTIFALGPRHIAMGGTGTATADDAFALYYNPANLAWIDRPTVSLGRQIDAELRPYSFAGFAIPLEFARDLGWRVTIGAARYPRVHARSTGPFAETDPESIFLRVLLPGLSGTYDGDIDTKTLVNRFGAGFSPLSNPALSFGLTLDWIDCKTNSCGVHAGSDGFETASVHATALSLGFGVSYRASDRLTLSAAVTDIDTTLTVDAIATDDSGTVERFFTADVPRRINIEAAYQLRDDLLLAAGLQSFAGQYGDDPINVTSLHFGAEWQHGAHWQTRYGLWAPIEILIGTSSDFELPFPAAPTIGIGWENGGLSADLAVFAHPIMTFHENAPAVSAEASVSYRF